jgi:TP901 family phage tail tape measure protein
LPADSDFAALKKSVLSISMEFGIAAEEISKIMQTAGQLGIRGTTSLTSFTKTVAQLTITTGESAGTLAMMLGKFTNIMGIAGLKGKEFEDAMFNIGNVLTHLGNRSATTEKDILKFSVRLAAAGSLVGMEFQDIMAIAAAAEASGTKAER